MATALVNGLTGTVATADAIISGQRIIVGLTGRNCAGKGAVADLLKAASWSYFSLSDAIRDHLRDIGQPESRDNLIAAGIALRREHGAGTLATRIMAKISGLPSGGRCIVDSIRTPGEVAVLRQDPVFLLVEVQADMRLRYERLLARNRIGDSASFEEFQRHEAAETTSVDAATQQLQSVASLVDVVIPNNGTAADLACHVHQFIRDYCEGQLRKISPETSRRR